MATTTSNSVVAFFSTEGQAAKAISALKDAGFQPHQIGAATNAGTQDVTVSSTYADTSTSPTAGTSAAHSTTGAKAEGMWDRVKNFFEGNEGTEGGVEQYADERSRDNTSHEITRGGYAGSSAYEPADVSHSLTGMQVPEEHSRYFEHRLSTGNGVLVTVSAADRAAEARSILEQNGGDLGANAESYDYSAAPAAAQTTGEGQQRIQLLGEVLRVHKDRISRGEVRIRKETITEQQTIQVPVTREELVIERVPVSGQTAVHGSIGENSDIRIPLSEERASADKQTFVREEVSVGKRAVESVEEVGGSVQHEELQVENDTTRTGETTRTR